MKALIKLTILCFLISSCNKENEPELWGKWLNTDKQIDYKLVIEFREDHIYKVYIHDSLIYESTFTLTHRGNYNVILFNDGSYLNCETHYSFRGPYVLVLTPNCLDRIISPPPEIYIKLL